eukprot:COSAG02_NODE_4902_length_4849_cov_8.392280_2_plen_355_part_00
MDVLLERYAADGYVVIDDAVPASLVAELNAVFDSRLAWEKDPREAYIVGFEKYRFRGGSLQPGISDAERHSGAERDYSDERALRFDPPRGWDVIAKPPGSPSTPAFRALIDPPAVAPLLAELLADPRWGHIDPAVPIADRAHYRLDHDNMDFKGGYEPSSDGAGPGDGQLHGHVANHHVTAVYELVDVGPGDGGFCCVPGSHRPDFRWPNGMDISTRDKQQHGWRKPLGGAWLPEIGVRRVEAKAGQCIVFSEKLLHATVPWTGATQRRTVFYKYAPSCMHHGDRGYDLTDPGLTAAQRDRIAFPRRWIDVDKKAKYLRAMSRRHGPDEWPTEVDVNGTDARDTLDRRTFVGKL